MSRQSKDNPAPVRSRRLWIIIGVLGILAIAAAAGLSTKGGPTATNATIGETQMVTVTGTALPRYPKQGADPAIGMRAPQLSGSSFDGTRISIGDDGKPKIIVFLTHWCPHCQNDVNELTPYIDENGLPPGVEFYSVATATDATAPNYPPSKWLADWPVPTMADSPENTAANAFGLNAFPFFVFVTADGKVDFRFPGEIPPEALFQAAERLAASQ
ncbi:soluble secreted antigen MPT53 precursor [bacterium BMS3Abin02]|nr:soluble secreted antigen MPT53 precursor [bacterium BMS3Abin02]HDK46043.1 thioredoxin family protein [Actinomycetota bacterium]HDL50305.1 thioredoxin family protein [Actinomycetota bacterium]